MTALDRLCSIGRAKWGKRLQTKAVKDSAFNRLLTCLAVVGIIAATVLTLENFDSPAVVGVFLVLMAVILASINIDNLG